MNVLVLKDIPKMVLNVQVPYFNFFCYCQLTICDSDQLKESTDIPGLQ